ncbi:hypothetical protein C6496_06110 [Candidatus Poribacteria bacterium]|nr:MAG: hypothetical protein C6496_06110 [Candidatus Poribacteria bacterium]
MANCELDEIRRIRREISARFDHDMDKLIAHYQALEEEYRKSGKYKFVDPPSEKPKERGRYNVAFKNTVF